MTEQSHTPGPWGAVVDNGRTIIYLMQSYLGNHIAYLSDGGVPEEQEAANARLIASAPELLEALDKASAAIQRLHTDVEALMADSEGVYGLHGNGDPAPWDELREGGRFDDWIGEPLSAARRAYHDARATIAKATGQ